MAKIPNKIRNTLNTYLDSLKQNNIPVESAFLFGSYSSGKNTDSSDIDFAIVSDVFIGNRIADRSKVRKITLSVSSDLEILPFNPKDFNESNPFAREIIETGIRIV